MLKYFTRYTFAIAITNVYVSNFVGGAGATIVTAYRVPCMHKQGPRGVSCHARAFCPQTSEDGNIDDSDNVNRYNIQQPIPTSIKEIETAIQDRNVDDDRYINISDRNVDVMYENIDAIIQS